MVLLFIGDDSYSKEKAVRDLRSSLADASSREFDYNVFRAGESDPIEGLELALTAPFKAKKRLVVIKDFEKSSQAFLSRLSSYVKKPSPSTCLVLDCEDEKFLSANLDFAAHCEIRRFDAIRGPGLEAWIRKYLSSAGKRISQEALDTISAQNPEDLQFLSCELDKLTAFSGSRSEIGQADVEEVLIKGLSAQTFDLANAIDSRDMGGAMKVISALLAGGRKHYEIVGLLCWHIKRLWRAKMYLEQGRDARYVSQVLKIHHRYQHEFFRQVNSASRSAIQRRLEGLLEADLDIKRTRFDPVLILEYAVIRLCLG